MQIIDRGGVLKIILTQAEGRRLRDASYIGKRIASNVDDADRATKLRIAADMFLAAANEFTPAQETLDRQDAEQPPTGDEKTEQPRRRQQPAK